MNFLEITIWLLVLYVAYYIINIIYDVLFFKEGKTNKNTSQKIFSVELEEERVTKVEDLEAEENSESTEQEVDVTLENTGIPVNELSKTSIFKNISFY